MTDVMLKMSGTEDADKLQAGPGGWSTSSGLMSHGVSSPTSVIVLGTSGSWGRVTTRLEFDAEGVLAVAVETGTYGWGRNPTEATVALDEALIRYRRFLERRGSARLSNELRAHLKFLSGVEPIKQPDYSAANILLNNATELRIGSSLASSTHGTSSNRSLALAA